MTNDRQIERLLDSWFSEGPIVVPDRTIDGVAARITRQAQRPAWRLLPWRFPTVNTPLKLVLIGAALIVALAAGSILIAGGRGAGPLATPTATPTASPLALKAGPLEPGVYRVRPSDASSLTWTVTVPAGWSAYENWAVVGPELPGNIGTALFIAEKVAVPADSCHAEGTPPASNVADFIASVEARDDWVVSKPVDVEVGGYSGQRIDVELPADVTACGANTDYFVTAEDGKKGFYAQAPSNRFTFWALDVAGAPRVFMRSSFAAVPAKEISETDAMVASSVIAP
jgi:hypothetical protein